jgi:hypothetical protein
MRKIFTIIGAVILGICIGAIAPHIFSRDVDTSWWPVITKGKNFGVTYNSSVVLTDLPMPEIKSVSGRAKFVDSVGPGQSTELGYIIDVEMGPLDLSKVPQRYKEEKKEMIKGYEITNLPVEQAYYVVEFDFDLKDKDGFVLQTVHARDVPSLVSGVKNTFQAKIEDAIPYATAIKVQEISIRPSIVKCQTCKPKINSSPTMRQQ